jgi:FAD/FMN-containing dehydrogenase
MEMQYGKRQMRLWVTDVCVPPSHLAQVISETETDFRQSPVQLPCPIVGHVADGNFHCLVPFNASDVLEVAEMRRLNERLVQRALAYEGTASGEHGVGMGKIDALYQVRRQHTHIHTHARARAHTHTHTHTQHATPPTTTPTILQERGLVAVQTMTNIKRALDPHMIMNPKKLFRQEDTKLSA